MIKLYQFPPIWGLPNASPFCMKVETYLRMAELSYENRFVFDPRKSPKGKFPFIKFDEMVVADSECIIEFIKKKFKDVLDNKLRAEQNAQIMMLESVFSDRLYWLMLYTRWQEDLGWQHVKRAYFAKLPWMKKLFLPKLIRNNMKKALYLQGTGRHQSAEILHMSYKTLDGLATILGKNPYFLGQEITSIDATAFGFLANIVYLPYNCPLKIYLYEHHPNLIGYCAQIWKLFYPELKQPVFQ